jgi:hypothetical protein
LWQQKSWPKGGFVEMIHFSAVLGSYRSSFHTLIAEIEDKYVLVGPVVVQTGTREQAEENM